MNERQYLLIKLIEECAEVSQRATKALTFGMYESQSQNPLSTNTRPETKLNNNERLCQEFEDLIAVSSMLNEHIAKPLSVKNSAAKGAKIEKMRKYMDCSRLQGTLEPKLEPQKASSEKARP